MENIYVLVLVVVFCSAIGLLLLMQNPRRKINQLYMLLTASSMAVVVTNFLSYDPRGDQLLYIRLMMAAMAVSVLIFYILVRAMFIGRHTASTYVGMALFTAVVVGVSLSSLLFGGMTWTVPPRPVDVGAGIMVLAMHLTLFVAMATSILVKHTQARARSKQRQAAMLLIGLVPILVLLPVTSIFAPYILGIPSTAHFMPLLVLLFLISLAYAIVRYGQFSVKRATVRTLVYLLSLGVLSATYFFLAFVAQYMLMSGDQLSSVEQALLNVGLALVLAVAYQPIKNFFDLGTERLFFRAQYHTEDLLSSVSDIMTSTKSVSNLATDVTREVHGALKAEFVFLLVEVKGARTIGFSGSGRLSKRDEAEAIAYAEKLMTHAKHDSPVELIPSQELDVQNDLVHLAVVLPSYADVSGAIILGEQKTGSGYTQRDINALKTISNWVVIAARSAQSILDIRELNTHLQQRIDDATKELRNSNERLKELDVAKDEFVSMASHQLRTPLTSVKGYISMVLEGDVGKISDTQRHLLSEAFASSERMVHLIGDFLNVSRLQTGKFMLETHPTDLARVIEQEVDAMRQISSSHGIQIRYKKPSRTPVLVIDEGKIRQVLMNFIDNAIYYSPDSSVIDVSLKVEDGSLVCRVADDGIGVPESVQKRLFTKFFRAPNARKQRPDGTGIGLYLAKQVLDAHGGSVLFDSHRGRGSTFGFRLPVKKLLLQSELAKTRE